MADMAQRMPTMEIIYPSNAREYSSCVARYRGNNCAMKSSSSALTVDSPNFVYENNATMLIPKATQTKAIGLTGSKNPKTGTESMTFLLRDRKSLQVS